MRMSTPLLASERRARLRELLAQDGAIRLESAAELLRVSAMTVFPAPPLSCARS